MKVQAGLSNRKWEVSQQKGLSLQQGVNDMMEVEKVNRY